jgi:hypothetical protein
MLISEIIRVDEVSMAVTRAEKAKVRASLLARMVAKLRKTGMSEKEAQEAARRAFDEPLPPGMPSFDEL